MSDAAEVLGSLAVGLALDTTESGRKTLDVLRARSPELFELGEQAGEDLIETSAKFVEVLLAAVRSDVEAGWAAYEQRAREHGRLMAAQGVALESAMDLLAVHRRVTIELLAQPLEGTPNRDEVISLAQGRIEDVVERLASSMARGYLDHLDEQHRRRESELYGLAAIAAIMGRSLDIGETAEVALAETLAAFGLDTGAIWLRERATYRLAHTIGLDPEELGDYVARAGPGVKASVSAIGRSESKVDGVAGHDQWNALRAQLRTGGRTVGMLSIASRRERIFGAADLLFMAAVGDQVAIALDRSRQFTSEARTDHLTGLANRREFERVMEREVARSERNGRALTVMMVDVDNLKKINDRDGHGAGDIALKRVAQELQRVVRSSDVCGRIGGDEFAVAMPETELNRAREVTRRLRAAMTSMNLASKSVNTVEVSVGLGAWLRGMDWRAVCGVADMELYEDKQHRHEMRRLGGERRSKGSVGLGASRGKRRLA